jgi:hypothetical protein
VTTTIPAARRDVSLRRRMIPHRDAGIVPEPPSIVYVDYEICVICNCYACCCDWDDYYYEEYAYYNPGPPLITLENLNFVLTSGAILANGIMISQDQRSPVAASFGYAFGASSIILAVTGRTSNPVASLILGTASIVLATWNLQIQQDVLPSGDPWHEGSYQSRTASPAAGITFSF